jgi:hypothetical protein
MSKEREAISVSHQHANGTNPKHWFIYCLHNIPTHASNQAASNISPVWLCFGVLFNQTRGMGQERSVGTIRTIPPSSQSLAIDDLERPTAALHGSAANLRPTVNGWRYQYLYYIVIYFKATTKHEEKPPRPEPHTNKSPLRGSHIFTSFPLDIGEKHRSDVPPDLP